MNMSKKTLTKQEHQGQYSKFIDALRGARFQTGLTQSEVAKLLGRSQDWVSRCETGEHRVDIVELLAFLKIYKQEVASFLQLIDKANINN
jgi:transcriptional regulator with XRE-family HTH domain